MADVLSPSTDTGRAEVMFQYALYLGEWGVLVSHIYLPPSGCSHQPSPLCPLHLPVVGQVTAPCLVQRGSEPGDP